MPFQARCQHCHKESTAPDGADGKRLRCPHCQEVFAVVHMEPEPVKAAPLPPAMPALHLAWEYHVEDLFEPASSNNQTAKNVEAKRRALSLPIEQRLNVLGAEGWELAAARYCPPDSHTLVAQIGFWKLIFKRPRSSV